MRALSRIIRTARFPGDNALTYARLPIMAKRKSPHAAVIGRRGGRQAWAGKTPEERSEIMRARWVIRRSKTPPTDALTELLTQLAPPR